jgi:hypothetical protein
MLQGKHTVSIFSPEDGDSMFLQNVGLYLQVYMVSQPRSTSSSPPGLFPVGECKEHCLQRLRHRTTEVTATVADAMPENTWQEIKYHLNVCQAMDGAHIEIW